MVSAGDIVLIHSGLYREAVVIEKSMFLAEMFFRGEMPHRSGWQSIRFLLPLRQGCSGFRFHEADVGAVEEVVDIKVFTEIASAHGLP